MCTVKSDHETSGRYNLILQSILIHWANTDRRKAANTLHAPWKRTTDTWRPHAPIRTGNKELPELHVLPQWKTYNLYLRFQMVLMVVELSFDGRLLWSVASQAKHGQSALEDPSFRYSRHALTVSLATALPDAAVMPADQSDGKAPHRKWMSAWL